jgi:ceramide glucosyltransferase
MRANADRAEAIASLLALDYSDIEILVSIDSPDATPDLVEGLRDRYRGRVTVLLVPEKQGPNGKIDAMEAAENSASNELLLFSDDDAVVPPDHVDRLVEQLRGDTVLVSAAAIGVRPKNLWGYLEVAFMNGQFARLHLAGDFLGFSGALGKTMLVRKLDLARVGGLRAAGSDCCEDAALTRNVKAAGLKVALSAKPVQQPILDQEFSEVWRRHVRWLGCRRKYLPPVFACEALLSAPAAVIAAGAAASWTSAMATVVLWCIADLAFAKAAGWPIGWRSPIAWLVREAIFLPMWLCALAIRTVTWHGRRVPLS